MSLVQPSRSMFLKTTRFSRGCGGADLGQRRVARLSFSSLAASSSLIFSLKRSSTMATGAVPQLARHSTNSIEYSPSARRRWDCRGSALAMMRIFFRSHFCQVDARRRGDLVPQLVAAGHGAGKRAADADVAFARRLPAEHRVEGDQFQDIDRRQFELLRDPCDGLVADEAKMLLPEVQQGQRRRSASMPGNARSLRRFWRAVRAARSSEIHWAAGAAAFSIARVVRRGVSPK